MVSGKLAKPGDFSMAVNFFGYQLRLTGLVRLDKASDADNVIEKIVKAHPENYQVYLERGSYLRRFGQIPKKRENAKKDLQIALEKGPSDPKVYTELAALALLSKNDEEARRVIEDGLKVSTAVRN